MFPPSSSGLAFAVHAQCAQRAPRLVGKHKKKRDAQSPKNFQSLVTFLRVPAPRTDFRRELRGQRFVLPICRKKKNLISACLSPTSAFSSRFDSHSCGCFEPLSCIPLLPATRLAPRKCTSNGIQGATGMAVIVREPRGRAVRGRDEERRVPCSNSNCSIGRGCTKRPPT